jgi:flagellar biogenesis protein FliO
MLKNKTTSENATQFATQNKTQVESPSVDLTGLITVLGLVGIIGYVLFVAVDNGRSSKFQDNQIIKELIKERR